MANQNNGARAQALTPQAQKAQAAIASAEQKFLKLARESEVGLSFQTESFYALQRIMENQQLARIAANNVTSLRMAVVNVAAVGLTLNPAEKLAYLVPRDGRVVLDISYRGLIKIAVDVGAITMAKPELVYEKDQFEWRGPMDAPLHKANVFDPNRGEVIGGYCIATLPNGSVMVETMTAADFDQVQATSKAQNGPWKTWPDQMKKKSLVKRASNYWPSGQSQRLAQAIDLLNQHEGLQDRYMAHTQQGDTDTGPEEEKGSVVDSYDESKIDDAVKSRVEELVSRAERAGAWAAAEEYARDRYQGAELAYAIDSLRQAQQGQA